MVLLGQIKGLAALDRGDDFRRESMGFLQLSLVGFGDSGLLVDGREDRGPVFRSFVRTLDVEFGRIWRDREVDLQEFAVGDLAWDERDR